jgi:hypothetical protein
VALKLKKKKFGNLDSFHVARDKNESLAVVNTAINFWSSLISETLIILIPNSDIIFTVISVQIIKYISKFQILLYLCEFIPPQEEFHSSELPAGQA